MWLVASGLWSLLLMVPLEPVLPGRNLDIAWMMALNEAVLHRMRFGSEIIFPLGPYASLETQLYHPRLFPLTFLGCMGLGLGMLAAVLVLMRRGGMERGSVLWLMPIWAAVLYFPLADTFFLLYPLVALFTYVALNEPGPQPVSVAIERAVMGYLACALALVSLVKGSFALSCAFSLTLICATAVHRRRYLQAAILIAVYGLSLLSLWILAGQRVADLPRFVDSMRLIVAGYSDAMSTSGPSLEIWVFGVLSLGVLYCIGRSFPVGRHGPTTFLLIGGTAATLFLVLKASLVRHDAHALMAPAFLVGVTYVLLVWKASRTAMVLLVLAIGAYVGMTQHYTRLAPRPLARLLLSRAAEPPLAVARRMRQGPLAARYRRAMDEIRAAGPLPPVVGSADIISFGQDRLIAAGVEYRPRPVIQSYSVYTAELQRINAAFFAGPRAPEHVFFAVQAIDQKLPALEDSRAWLQVLNCYDRVAWEGDLAHFQHRASGCRQDPERMFERVDSTIGRLGDAIPLPAAAGWLWAEVDVEPTTLGRALDVVFKLPQLTISVTTADHHVHEYRYAAGMGRGGFLVSPLIGSTREVEAMTGTMAAPAAPQPVVSISIGPRSPRSGWWWRREVKATFYKVLLPLGSNVPSVAAMDRDGSPPAPAVR